MEHEGQGAPDDPHLCPRLQEGVHLRVSSASMLRGWGWGPPSQRVTAHSWWSVPEG